jgi:hypothetical protein
MSPGARLNWNVGLTTELRMIQSIIEIIIEYGFQAVGWAVLKTVTLGRYQGFTSDDMLREGALGLVTVLAVGYGFYRWL